MVRAFSAGAAPSRKATATATRASTGAAASAGSRRYSPRPPSAGTLTV